jgi:hypothetical protein
LLGKTIAVFGVQLKARPTLNLLGNVSGADNDSNNSTDVTITTGPQFAVDGASATLAKGDWVCPLPSDPTKLTKATTAAVLAAKAVTGVVGAAYAPGAAVSSLYTIGQVAPASVFSDLGAGAATDLQLNALARAVRQPRRSGGEIILGTTDTSGNVTVKPNVPINTASRLSYNPATYGAAFDNVTDDFDAWTAMFADMAAHAPNAGAGYLVEIPLGLSYVRDAVFFDRGCIVVGHSGGGQHGLSGVRSAPGKCTIIANNGVAIAGYQVPAGSSDASWCHFERLDLRSSALVPVHTNPYSLSGGISGHRATSTAYEKGVCVLDLSSVNVGDGGTATVGNGTKVGVFFRVTSNAGDKKTSATAEGSLTGTGSRTFANAFPGDVFTDGNVTWTAEAFVSKRIRNYALRVGDAIMNVGADRYNGGTPYTQDDDNRYYFVCTVAGTTFNGTAPVAYNQPQVGALITDGGATLRVMVHAALFSTAGSTTARRITIKDCTNYGVHLWGQTGQGSDADFDIVDNIYVQSNTGGGVFIGTDQAQGCSVGRIFVDFAGIITPGSTQINNAGGHSYYGHSQGGEDVAMVYGQFSFGRNIFTLAANTVIRSTFSECSLGDIIANGVIKIGGTPGSAAPITPDGGVILAGINGYGRGLVEYDKLSGTTGGRGFTKQDSAGGLGMTLDWWNISTDGASQWQRIYNWSGGGLLNTGTGWDAEVWKTSGGYSSIGRGRSHYGSAQGPGFDRDYQGHFAGSEGGTIAWRGTVNAGFDSQTSKQIRMGATNTDSAHFLAGDWFEYLDNTSAGIWRFKILTSAGHGGLPRLDNTQYFTSGPNDYAAQVIRIGSKVFRCTTSGVTQTGVPAGYGSAGIGATVTDGTAVFTRSTDAPTEGWFGFIEDPSIAQTPQTTTLWKDTPGITGTTQPKGAIPSFRRDATTSSTGTNQVLTTLDNALFTVPPVAGALPDHAFYRVNVTCVAKANATATEQGSCDLKGDFYREGGSLTRVGTDVAATNFTLATTCRLNINGNTVEVQTSPATATQMNWEVIGQIFQRID